VQIVKAAEPVYVALLCLVIRPIEVMCVSVVRCKERHCLAALSRFRQQ
jgi:hypothetical protein